MSKHTNDRKIWKIVNAFNGLDCCLMIGLRKYPNSRHAGIQRDMNLNFYAKLRYHFG